jgi:hypothetical protein
MAGTVRATERHENPLCFDTFESTTNHAALGARRVKRWRAERVAKNTYSNILRSPLDFRVLPPTDRGQECSLVTGRKIRRKDYCLGGPRVRQVGVRIILQLPSDPEKPLKGIAKASFDTEKPYKDLEITVTKSVL